MNGSLCWVYCSETVVDSALGLCVGSLFGTILILSLTLNYLMASSLNVYGVFWMFAGFAFTGGLFCFFFIKETKGLNDIEKKELYYPTEVNHSETGGNEKPIESAISDEE
jgi:hypothetical protein